MNASGTEKLCQSTARGALILLSEAILKGETVIMPDGSLNNDAMARAWKYISGSFPLEVEFVKSDVMGFYEMEMDFIMGCPTCEKYLRLPFLIDHLEKDHTWPKEAISKWLEYTGH